MTVIDLILQDAGENVSEEIVDDQVKIMAVKCNPSGFLMR